MFYVRVDVGLIKKKFYTQNYKIPKLSRTLNKIQGLSWPWIHNCKFQNFQGMREPCNSITKVVDVRKDGNCLFTTLAR